MNKRQYENVREILVKERVRLLNVLESQGDFPNQLDVIAHDVNKKAIMDLDDRYNLNLETKDFGAFAKKVLKTWEKEKTEEDGNEKPVGLYCRHSSWKGEPCDNCGCTASPYDVGGRYIIGGEPDSDGYIDKHPLLVCGNCLEKLKALFDLGME